MLYDGNLEIYLGSYIVENNNESKLRDNYREWDSYKVYNQGITQTWSWLSNPHFMISIARGMQYTKSAMFVMAFILGCDLIALAILLRDSKK